MKVLVINAGSSSLKYRVMDMDGEKVLAKGLAERIGEKVSRLVHNPVGKPSREFAVALPDHKRALKLVLSVLTDKDCGVMSDISEIDAVGHRVLHSGEDFKDSVLIDDEVVRLCKKNAVLGPLHMRPNISCIEACRKLLPNVPMTAVFDTTFHRTMPDYAYMYAIPYGDYEKYKIRKYGFHGTSHKYVTGEAMKYLKTDKLRLITCHLGNGSSLAAVKDGKCLDTSMGLTPLEGVVMGTRSGDLDPAVVDFMASMKGLNAAEVLEILNKKSGFLGIAGVGDFRDLCRLVESGDERAVLALRMFGHRVRKYIGGYFVVLGGLDCIVLTGGIGENSATGRAEIMRGLECLGVDFDFALNEKVPGGKFAVLSKPESRVKVLVIPTDEELVIARDAARFAAKS